MLLEKFLKYVSCDTAADYNSTSVPSTPKQLVFLNALQGELIEMGLCDVEICNRAVLFASIKPSVGCENDDPIGLIAHVDTSPDAPSDNINPIVHKNYDGKDIVLPFTTISVNNYPELSQFRGHTLITSDGRTLLGADDKAGVAILMLLPKLLKNNDIKHPLIRLAFTTDEEIGRSIDNFDVQKFGVKVAYTLDSGGTNLLEYENFNASGITVTIEGKNIHPGYALGKMVNSCDIATEFNQLLPQSEKPLYTSGREGFFHLNNIQAEVDKAVLHYIIRDFDAINLKNRLQKVTQIADSLAKKYSTKIQVNVEQQYENMRQFIPQSVIDRARRAYLSVGIEPLELPIRGGTDGARLSTLGVPTPNLFNGGMNFHSKHEYCSLDAMQKALEMVVELVKCE